MKLTNSAIRGPLLLTIATSVVATLLWNPTFQRSTLLVAAADDGGDSCLEGGLCLAPDDDDDDSSDDSGDDDSSDDSSDEYNDSSDDDDSGDGTDRHNGNQHAHIAEDEDPEDNRSTCHQYLNLDGYRHFPETSSFYQEMEWSEHVDTLDTCMTLDNIVQICDSYRPHYHEPFVHFPAAYLNEFRRVAFVGGGDAMLLHEALKYPNVELVLGLELDQKNARESLKHFRIEPHFDDERVQWWFGDAAKSLTLLPREWFGTFDLVMVDLSETGMSISVNDDLDIFGALALLLKPEGIMVKNENYFSQMNKYFDYTVSVYMDNYPKLCDQDWAMGSNKVDFLRPKLQAGLVEENRVKTLAYLPLEDEDEHYKMIVDYSHNDARKQGQCDEYDAQVLKRKNDGVIEENEKEPVKPTKSSGILLVADADNATNTLDLSSFKHALVGLGMTPLEPSCFSLPSSEGTTASLFIGMEEGYISAHSYPQKPSSIGLEILLWSKLGKQNNVLLSLLDVMGVGGNSYSSYRVIHGGMNGHANWKEEMNTIGPAKKTTRECDPTIKAIDTEEKNISQEHYNAVVTESLSLLGKKSDKTVAVLCGVRGVHACTSLDSIKVVRRVERVIAIWTCPDGKDRTGMELEEEDDNTGTSLSHIYACGEDDIFQSATSEDGYSALIVDRAAPSDLVAIGEGIFCSDRILDSRRHAFLRERVTFVVPLSSEADKKSIFARCLRRISKRLIRSAVVVLDKSEAVGVVVSANDSFPRRLVTVAQNVEKKTGVSTEIDKIKSGPVPFQDDYDPDEAPQYAPLEAMKQYVHQMPMASQSIYQLEVRNVDDIKTLSRTSSKEILDSIIGKSQRFASSQDAYFEAGDGSVAVVSSHSGHIFVTWNGAGLFTINVLTDGEQYEKVHRGNDLGPDMVLVDHKAEIIDVFMSKLPASTVIAVREQMPRGANHVVNFQSDMSGTPGCADYYQFCKEFARDGDCNKNEDKQWMRENCALSCGTCGEMEKRL